MTAGDDTGDTARSEATCPDRVLEALREDVAGTLASRANQLGWPLPCGDGLLFVHAEGGDWSLAGDFDGWEGQPMNREDGFSWLVADATGAYKFTDGTDWLADPWARRYGYDEFGEMSYATADGAHLERLFEVEGDGIPARTLRVWVPAGEATHVLYAHDGQNLFDLNAFWGGWRLDESVPDGMLVVGIDNGPARMDEYTHVEDVIDGTTYGGDGDLYAAYVQDAVRPLVAEVYGEPATVGLMGSSLGGLISFHVADRHPGEYAFAASLSGTMGWGSIGSHNETMIERYAAAGLRDTALYLDSGGGGTCYDADGDGIMDDDPDAADNYCENVQLRDVLADAGYQFEVDLWHWHEPGAEHTEAAWGDRVWRPLEIFAGL
ncbi:MAG: alpha/beta hydrolase [Myxococcota bacterium]